MEVNQIPTSRNQEGTGLSIGKFSKLLGAPEHGQRAHKKWI